MRLPFMFAFVGALLLLAAHLSGCAVSAPLPHRDPSASWDQANLKLNDRGCPSAVFVAPAGNLVQCALPSKPEAQKFFPTADAAALYVVGKIYENSRYYEYGGVIGKSPKSGYAPSKPQTQRHGTNVEIDEDPESYSYPIIATYHVHPCLKGVFPGVFSPQDLAGARATNHPAYVLDECTGLLHYWAPGDGYLNATELMGMGIFNPDVQVSAGKIVGKIAVDGVMLN